MIRCSDFSLAAAALAFVLISASFTTEALGAAEAVKPGRTLTRFYTENASPSGMEVEVIAVGPEGNGMICRPSGIWPEPGGAFVLTDLYHHTLWRAEGGHFQKLYGGNGDQETLAAPWGVVPYRGGYAVSDSENDKVYLLRDGALSVLAGGGDTTAADGYQAAGEVRLDNPTGLAADDQGNLYISDTSHSLIRRLDASGGISSFSRGLREPTGLFWHGGALYAADSGNDRICRLDGVREGDLSKAELTVVSGGGSGPGENSGLLDGPVDQARFSHPQGILVSDDGVLYIADTGNGAVRKLENGQAVTLLRLDGQRPGTHPVSPRGLALYGDSLYITDTFTKTIVRLSLYEKGEERDERR